MKKQNGDFGIILLVLLILVVKTGEAGSGVIEWKESVYGSVSPINLTMGYPPSMVSAAQRLSHSDLTTLMNHCAVALYEMTNGAHYLGRIKIIEPDNVIFDEIKNVCFPERFHVLWNFGDSSIKTAHSDAGNYIPYRQHGNRGSIYMLNHQLYKGDYFEKIGGLSNNLRLGGYMLAHELGHFVYGVGDEYEFASGNTTLREGSDMSVMSFAHNAILNTNTPKITKPGSATWLNFSTAYNYDKSAKDNQQVSLFGCSAWEAIASKSNPSKSILAGYQKYWYEDLAKTAPKGSDPKKEEGWYKLEYPEYGLPQQNAVDFSPLPKLPVIEFGNPARVRVILIDKTKDSVPTSENPESLGWFTNYPLSIAVHIIKDLINNYPTDGMEYHLAIFAFGETLEEILPFQKIEGKDPAEAIKLLASKMSWFPYKAYYSTERRLFYDCLAQVLGDSGRFSMPRYMKDKNIILGDIAVFIPGRDGGSVHSVEELVKKARELFIPVNSFFFGPENNKKGASAEMELFINQVGGRKSHTNTPIVPEKIIWYKDMPLIPHRGDPIVIAPWLPVVHVTVEDLYLAWKGMRPSFGSTDPRILASSWPKPGLTTMRDNIVQTVQENLPEKQVLVAPKFGASISKLNEKSPLVYRGNSPDSIFFPVDHSLRRANIVINTESLIGSIRNIDLDFFLIDPNEQLHPAQFEFIDMGSDFSGRKIYWTSIEIDESLVGEWSLLMNNYTTIDGEGCKVNVEIEITGDAGSMERAILHDISAVNATGGIFNAAEDDGWVTLIGGVQQGGVSYTDLSSVSLSVLRPDGSVGGGVLRDDGVYPDVMARDGLYTGRIYCGEEGLYAITSQAHNRNGTARETKLLTYRDKFDLDGPSPFFGETITENFTRYGVTEFTVINDPASANPAQAPQEPYYALSMSDIKGPRNIVAGIEAEFSIDINTTLEALENYISWSLPQGGNLKFTHTSDGPRDTAKVLLDPFSGNGSLNVPLKVNYTVPQALVGVMQPVEKTMTLYGWMPIIEGSAFENRTVFAGEDIDFDGQLWMPDGYSREATWSVAGQADVAQLLRQDENGCTIRTKKPGRFVLSLVSDPHPDVANRSVEIKVIHKEQGDSLIPNPNDNDGSTPKPIPDNPDPGGDDNVDTDSSGGGAYPGDDLIDGNSGDSDSGKKPGYEEWEEADANAPKLLKVTVDGWTPASADVMSMRQAILRFEFDERIARYYISAILSGDLALGQGKNYAVISGFTSSKDGKILTASFLPKQEGFFVLYYNFEGENGQSLRGGFGLHAGKTSETIPSTPPQSNSGGGGCGISPWWIGLFLLSICGLREIVRRKKIFFWICVLFVFFTTTSAVSAATYVVTNSGDDLDFPPPGSLRSVLYTIDLLGSRGDVIQFAPQIETIELKGALKMGNSSTLDGYTGRAGKRVVLTLATGGYRHIKNGNDALGDQHALSFTSDFSAYGIVFKGFGKNDPRNIPGADNGGVYCYGAELLGTRLTNCSLIDIVGKDAPIVISFSGAYWGQYNIAIFEKCLFQNNVSETSAGAVRVTNGSIALQDTFVGYNRADKKGGACVSLAEGEEGGSGRSPLANNVSMHNTIASNYKGAVTPKDTLNHLRVSQVNSIFALGGQIAIPRAMSGATEPGLVTLSRCMIVGNETKASGGATSSVGLLLCNSTLVGNSAGLADSAISGVQPDFCASIFAGNDTETPNPDPDSYMYDEKRNLYADGVTESVLREIFEKYPLIEEDRGGYTPVIPIKYAGPAEGQIFSETRDSIDSSHPLAFDTDVRGVPRRYAVGASIGAYEFGVVTIEPGNIQNSKTIGFKPNDQGSVKVRLVERIVVGGLSAVNYLSGIPVSFSLLDGDNLEALPHKTETADNGRAFVVVNTLGAGTSVVRAALSNRPDRILDLQIKVGDEQGAGGSSSGGEKEDDLYVVALNPDLTAPDIENTYWATFSRACASSTVSIRRKGKAEYLLSGLAIDMLPSAYGKLREPISFENIGSYMFDFEMTDTKGRYYTDTKEVRVESSSLKVFKMSEPPYYEDKTLSMLSSFSIAPKGLSMLLKDEKGVEYKPEIYSKNGLLDWEGFVTVGRTGYYTATLEYVDGGDGKRHEESFTIFVTDYYGVGTTVTKGGGGCNASATWRLLVFLLFGIELTRRRAGG